MNLRRPLVLGAVVAALVTGVALPASAAPGDTATTFTLVSGSLSVTPSPTATLGAFTAGTTAISGSLGPVSVSDLRGGTVAWNVSATSTVFTGAAFAHTSTLVRYTGGVVTKTGTITIPAGVQKTLSATSVQVITTSAVVGVNTASWTPTLDVTMPSDALADSYSGTVTTSIL